MGSVLRVANGDGKRFMATITAIEKASIQLDMNGDCEEVAPPRVTLWIALIDKSAMEEACHLVAQLGVAAIRFVQTDFTNTHWQEKHTARLQKIILASCIQSEQAWLPEIHTQPQDLRALPWKEGLWHVAIERHRGRAELASKQFDEEAHEIGAREDNILIGPEGGWSAGELTYFKELMSSTDHNVYSMDLGMSILRAQTAALVACWSFTRQA